LIVFVGFLVFRGGDGNLARDRNNTEIGATTTEENLNGIGGPEEGFDPLEGMDTTEREYNYDENVDSKG
jgi:hypothetical protein